MLSHVYSATYQLLLQMLREARKGKGWTQADLARNLGMTQSAVSKCENGARRLDVIELRVWVHALGHDLPDFLDRFERRLSGRDLPVLRDPAASDEEGLSGRDDTLDG